MLLILILSILSFHFIGHPLPLPIDNLTDFGAVLDRHGRDRIGRLISDTKHDLGLEVYILASWEDPLTDIDTYTEAVLNTWQLANGHTLLAVFLRSGNAWNVQVASGKPVASAHPNLCTIVRDAITNLVEHDRVEEAMYQLFTALEEAMAREPGVSVSTTPNGQKQHIRLIMGVSTVCLVISFVLFATWRICPRCGRLLHRQSSHRSQSTSQSTKLYQCGHCGYTRRKT